MGFGRFGTGGLIYMSLENILKNTNGEEKANLKGQEIAKIVFSSIVSREEFDIEITGLKNIERGIELFARVWDKQGNPVGFGSDGTIEVERFRIFNPPVLVDDANGGIVRNIVDLNGEIKVRRLREDLKEALLQSLEHTIKMVGKSCDNVIRGTRGNTTSTFYPDANAVDGYVNRTGVSEVWATLRAGAGTGNLSSGAQLFWQIESAIASSPNFTALYRSIIMFDTAALPDTDIISSATLSLYGTEKVDASGNSPTGTIVGTTPASATALENADYSDFGATEFASRITYANWSTVAYNDFALNASGIAAVIKTGVSKFGFMEGEYDFAGGTPTYVSDKVDKMVASSSDVAGTTQDPKLVVVHASAATGNFLMFM